MTAPDGTAGPRRPVDHRLDLGDPMLRAFWIERQLATLTTLTPAGRPHTVPVAPVLDPDRGVLRILSSRGSRKVRNILARPETEGWASVCQVDGRRWCTVTGIAQVLDDRESVAEAERDHATRFRAPRPNPQRVVLVITVDSAMGTLR